MTEEANFLDSLHLSSLDTGTVVELHTRNRCYRIEYLEGDRVRISGHPKWCPTPALARLHGSKGGSYGFEEGYIRCGLRLLFERLDDCTQVVTSEITDIRVVNLN